MLPLVITIIILLVLAGVTISQLTENGLFENAKLSKEKYENSKSIEDEILGQYENAINGNYLLGNSREDTVTLKVSEYQSILTRLNNLESKTNPIGTIYTENFSNVSAEKDKSTILDSITLPAGKYVLVGYASYEGNDLRYHIFLGNIGSSAYDKNGYVRMNISTIVTPQTTTTYDFYIYVNDKNVTITNGFIKAIKISD